MLISKNFWHDSVDILSNDIRFGVLKYSRDFVVGVGHNTNVIEVTWHRNDTGVGVLSILLPIIIGKLFVHGFPDVLGFLDCSLTLDIIINDLLEEVPINLQAFDVVWVHVGEFLEDLVRALHGVGDFGAQGLEFLDVGVLLQQLPPELQVEVDGLLDGGEELNELILEDDDDVDIHALLLGATYIGLHHLLLDEVLVAVHRELLLEVRFVFLRDHQLIQGPEFVI